MSKAKKEKHVKWLMKQTAGARKHIAAISILSSLLVVLQLIWASYAVIELLDIATGDSYTPVSNIVWLFVIIVVLYAVFSYVATILEKKAFNITLSNSRAQILRAIYDRDFSNVQKRHSAELLMLLNEDSRTTSNTFIYIFKGIIYDAVMMVGAILLMLRLNWQVSLILMGTVVAYTILFRLFMSWVQKTSLRIHTAEEDIRKNLQDGVIKVLVMKAYFMIEKIVNKHYELYRIKTRANISGGRAEFAYNTTSSVMFFTNSIIVYGVGAFFVMGGYITVGTLVGLAALLVYLYSPSTNIGVHLQSIAAASASAKRIRTVTELPQEIDVDNTDIGQINMLEVTDVRFAYDDDNDVLKGVSLSARPGDIVGIIGESGSGKSTLTKILLGFYTPKSGEVRLRGSLGEKTSGMLNHIAYVPSSDFTFTGSIAENICMAEETDSEKMTQAVKDAGIHDFVESLPDRYGTLIGDGSHTLSSGQSQRIAIARALYHSKPILIFDEPTSNLDVESISVLHDTIRRVAEDKICIIVTHDEATKKICNKVYSIKDGKMS